VTSQVPQSTSIRRRRILTVIKGSVIECQFYRETKLEFYRKNNRRDNRQKNSKNCSSVKLFIFFSVSCNSKSFVSQNKNNKNIM